MADIIIPKAHVEWRALAVGQDSGDPDVEPDQIPLAGVRVRLTPSPRKVEVAATETEPARTVTLREWELVTDETGVLSNPEAPDDPIAVVASDAFAGVTIEWTSTISTPDTGVPDITKRWLAPTGSTVDLTTVTSIPPAPSPLPDYLAAVADARSARDVALSAADRAETAQHWAETARTGAETASGVAVAARDEAVPAAATAVSARDLAIAARDATLAASTIVGAGRPDVAASMTAPVQALVAAAGSGAEFRSLDGPQGAWVWRKRGATWVCVEGDTGVVDLAVCLPPGWELNPAAPYLAARRINSEIHFSGRIRVAAGAAFIGTNRSVRRDLIEALPGWLMPVGSDPTSYQPFGAALIAVGAGVTGAISSLASLAQISLDAPSASGVWAAGDAVSFSGSRPTSRTWPLTLTI